MDIRSDFFFIISVGIAILFRFLWVKNWLFLIYRFFCLGDQASASMAAGMANMTGMSGMSGMSGMPGMATMQAMPMMSGMSGMSAMPGMAGMPGMGGMPAMSGMSGMMGMPGMTGQNQQYVSVPPQSQVSPMRSRQKSVFLMALTIKAWGGG